MDSNLEQRFFKFIDSLDDTENLDDPKFNFPTNQRKADYLLNNRSIIAEVKTFQNNPKNKSDKLINNKLREDGIIIFGRVNLNQVFQPKEIERLGKKIFYTLTRNTEAIFSSAAKQISQTKNYLQLNESAGILIILNQSIEILEPEIILHRLDECFNKASSTSIQYCLLIFEFPFSPNKDEQISELHLYSFERSQISSLNKLYLKSLMEKWAKFNNSSYQENLATSIFKPSPYPEEKVKKYLLNIDEIDI